MVIGSSDLNKTLHYFFDLMENKTILGSGSCLTPKQVKANKELKAMRLSIESILGTFFKKKTGITRPILSYIPHEKLFHGFCTTQADPLPIPIIYFNDIKMGVFYVTGIGGNTDSFRFSLIESSLSQPH